LRMEADRALLPMAMFNLISNAIKYNQPDGSISLRVEESESKILFTIGNSGPGIPLADEPKIFERFYRVQSSTGAPADGIGLGLSLAREIVRAHGGEISMLKSSSDWTVFQMQMPR